MIKVELEGEEYSFSHLLMDDPEVRTLSGTPKKIMTTMINNCGTSPYPLTEESRVVQDGDVIISKDTVFSKNSFKIKGTNKQIASLLNLMHGGKEFAHGSILIEPFTNQDLENGIKTEISEHFQTEETKGQAKVRQQAAKIAVDHLIENQLYYSEENIEKKDRPEKKPKILKISDNVYKCTRCGKTNLQLYFDGCKDAPCPMEYMGKHSQYVFQPTWLDILKTWKFWRQFIVYTIVSVAGMMISHYIPEKWFWPFWVPFSLFLGHLFNRENYK